jgi:hypothetical protein
MFWQSSYVTYTQLAVAPQSGVKGQFYINLAKVREHLNI